MKWPDILDLLVLFSLLVSVGLHSQGYMGDVMITLIAAPCMFYIMVVSDVLRKKWKKKQAKRNSYKMWR